MKMKQLFTNKGIFQVLLAFLLVISVMSVSNYIVYRNSISGIYEKMTQVNTLAMKNMIQSFDNNFRTIYNMIHTIHGMSFENSEAKTGTKIDMSRVYMLQDQISNLVNSTDYIEEAIVFYDDIDLAITSKGTSSFAHLFNEKYKHSVYNSGYWRNYMKSRNPLRVFSGETFTVPANSQSQQAYKKLMIVAGGNKVRLSSKNIILLINEEAFLKEIHQNLLIPGSSLVVLDQDRRVIAGTDNGADINDIFEKAIFGGSKEASVTKENYEYHLFKSDYNGYVYIEKLPYQFQNIESVTSANRMIMLVSIACAVFLSLLLSAYLYNPMKKILRQLGGTNIRGNDFVKVESGIIKLKQELDTCHDQLSVAAGEMRRAAILRGLYDFDWNMEQDEWLQQYAPGFYKFKYFMLVSVHIQNQNSKDEMKEVPEHVLDKLNLLVADDSRVAEIVYESGRRYLLFVGLNQATDREAQLRTISRKIMSVKDEELSDYVVWCSVSRAYTSESESYKKAFAEVKYDLRFRKLDGSFELVDVEQVKYQWSAYYPFEQIEKLSNYLMNGKLKECRDVITETIEENKNRNIPYCQFIHVAQSIFYAMLRRSESLLEENEELLQSERRLLDSLSVISSIANIEQELYKTAKLIVRHQKPEAASKLTPSFISQYIELHYMENLYLDDIAAVTETSPKYFSSYFKKAFGVNYVEYLNKVRLSHARELLRDTNLTIAEVGEKTGYLNSSTFTTTFKKYYGISPSEYRKQSNH